MSAVHAGVAENFCHLDAFTTQGGYRRVDQDVILAFDRRCRLRVCCAGKRRDGEEDK